MQHKNEAGFENFAEKLGPTRTKEGESPGSLNPRNPPSTCLRLDAGETCERGRLKEESARGAQSSSVSIWPTERVVKAQTELR